MVSIVVSVGGTSFPSKTVAIDYCRAILRNGNLGSEITGEDAVLVGAILKARPDKVRKIGPRKVVRYLRSKHTYNTACFFAELDDGTHLDFSFMKFIRNYPNPTG